MFARCRPGIKCEMRGAPSLRRLHLHSPVPGEHRARRTPERWGCCDLHQRPGSGRVRSGCRCRGRLGLAAIGASGDTALHILAAIPATWQSRSPVAGMSAHKFKIGQFVNYNPRPSGLGVRSDHPLVCTRSHSSCRRWATSRSIASRAGRRVMHRGFSRSLACCPSAHV